MADVRAKFVPPTISLKSFNCPTCGALAKQFWFFPHLDPLQKDEVPRVFVDEDVMKFAEQAKKGGDEDERKEHARVIALLKTVVKGAPVIERRRESESCYYNLLNVSVSQCYNCDAPAIWIRDHLAWPRIGGGPLPNPDIPDEARRDYEEASAILALSPRGAAALLRLAIQRLCMFLGEKGANLNDDIGSLVARGLDKRVQQALDVVRVVGNNAVHPGQIDLGDNGEVAHKLFDLVNLIAEIMISQPKHVSAMFDGLPEGARKGIEQRDKTKKD